ncbi:MAG: PIG-L family deacetylase, partial [Chitinophagaceae bacterium]
MIRFVGEQKHQFGDGRFDGAIAAAQHADLVQGFAGLVAPLRHPAAVALGNVENDHTTSNGTSQRIQKPGFRGCISRTVTFQHQPFQTRNAQNGADIHLICATCGGAGTNPDAKDNLADIRELEEKEAAEIVGVQSLELLRYEDGTLCNNSYLEIAEKVMAYIRKTLADCSEPYDVTLITFDSNGLSGHID